MIEKFISLGFFSFIVNVILLILIEKKVFGSKIKNLVEEISKSRKKAIFIYIYYFVFVYILFFKIRYSMNIIYLDSVNVNVTVNGVNASVTGDILNIAKEIFGDTAVFLGSARLAYLIVAKNNGLRSISKIGIVIGSGGGGLTTYRIFDKTLNSIGAERNKIILNGNLKLGSVNVTTTGNYNIPEHPVLSLLFGMNGGINVDNMQKPFSVIRSEGHTILQATNNNGVIQALDNHNFNWKSQFNNYISSENPYAPWIINNPNESELDLISFLIDQLTDHFYLTTISIYLLFMLFIIFICKLVLGTDIKFKRLSSIKFFK
jgi:hypothetical protein